MKLFEREIPLTPELTLEELEVHANGMLRYQNVADLVTQGPRAVQAFISRANAVFREKLTNNFHMASNNFPELKFFYKTIFFQAENQNEHEAIPMTDFIGFSFKDGEEIKYGYGVMFSFYGREYDRSRLEAQNQELGEIETASALYNAMFKNKSGDGNTGKPPYHHDGWH